MQYPALAQASQFLCESVYSHSSVPPSSGGKIFVRSFFMMETRDESEWKYLKYYELESERMFQTGGFSLVMVSLKDDGTDNECPANLKENSD